MKTVAEYRADLFVIASEFKTEDADELTKIDMLIGMAIEDYPASLPKYDRIVVYRVASQLRAAKLNAANVSGYQSVRAGSESVTYYSGSSIEGNTYLDELNKLLGVTDDGARRLFGARLGGVC